MQKPRGKSLRVNNTVIFWAKLELKICELTGGCERKRASQHKTPKKPGADLELELRCILGGLCFLHYITASLIRNNHINYQFAF